MVDRDNAQETISLHSAETAATQPPNLRRSVATERNAVLPQNGTQ